MKMTITAASNVGCVRHNNEDMILVGNEFVRNRDLVAEVELTPQSRTLVALADGMGGHNSGEIASHDVLCNLNYYYNDLPSGLMPGDFTEMIYDWLESINHVIDSKGRSEARYHDMGTTLVALSYYEGEFYWMNCGDSRLYHFRENSLVQLTTDHSLNSLMGTSAHSNIITNCIGGGCKTSYIDMVQCTKDILPGDVLLLCSDGLTDMVDDAHVQFLLSCGCDADTLVDAALEAGGHDNVSVCIIRIIE